MSTSTIQFRRQLKFAHPKDEAIKYIENKLTMLSGEPILCTYRESNGKWGSIDCVCVYPKNTLRTDTILSGDDYNHLFDDENKLMINCVKINGDDAIWETI